MSSHAKILIIDDDPALRQLVASSLQTAGYQLLTAGDGQEGLRQMYHSHPDLIVLDVNMPAMDGWTVCQRVREVSNVPIIMLTAQSDPEEIVKGLDLGADDYLIKPFEMGVLLARVRANLRRAASEPTLLKRGIVYSDDYLAVSFEDHRVTVQGDPVRLTPTEFNLLAHLVEASPRIVPYRELLQQTWGFEYIDDIDYLRVYIWHLRRKLEPNPKEPTYIINELGVGYRFDQQR
ncbi:MAG: response regulator transcription factor [Chloroflexota bacterium]|jgi:two-component system KDP operon response regulator KdpE|nr:response regulator transcription factor [Anaerolineae bacterium]HMM27909.1 response regulator transcription factor [Aggregatilineaceae bacterium]